MADKLVDSLRGRRLLMFGGGGAAAAVAVLGFAMARKPSSQPTPATGSKAQVAAPSGESRVAEAPLTPPPANVPSGSPSAPAVNAAKSPTIQVTLRVFPAVPATVTMGKTRLGTIQPQRSLVLERRRDSGPLDLVIRSPGFVSVHTRAYTFDNNTVEVRLTRVDKKDTLYGYREPLPPEDAGAAASGWVPLSSLFPSPPPPTTPMPSSQPAASSSALPRR